jgi:hypothetical protein
MEHRVHSTAQMVAYTAVLVLLGSAASFLKDYTMRARAHRSGGDVLRTLGLRPSANFGPRGFSNIYV